jgi:membrane associated rhomboid family serine protease
MSGARYSSRACFIPMASCACCGDVLSASAEPGDLCAVCIAALDSPDNALETANSGPPTMTELAERDAREWGRTKRAGPSPSYPVTKTLLVVNFGIFVLMAIAHLIWPGSNILRWGASWGPLSLTGQWWRLLTATFVHVGPVHVLGNLVMLWILGRRLELILGKWFFVFVYLSCAVTGSITSVAIHPQTLDAGLQVRCLGSREV